MEAMEIHFFSILQKKWRYDAKKKEWNYLF